MLQRVVALQRELLLRISNLLPAVSSFGSAFLAFLATLLLVADGGADLVFYQGAG